MARRLNHSSRQSLFSLNQASSWLILIVGGLIAALTPLRAQYTVQSDTSAVPTPTMALPSAVVGNPAPAARPAFTGTVFGERLFQGDFKEISFTGFNPHYPIAIGDTIQVMLWGAVQQQLMLTVDAQGNVFIPDVGPVHVQGVRNSDLNKVITERVAQTFIKSVNVYANLASSQPVKVFVSGGVMRPGLYTGYSSDIALYFLDKAGGIDPVRGSFIDISIIRQNVVVETLSVYDFITKGQVNQIQFTDGDIILVRPQHQSVQFGGEVSNPLRFEFKGANVKLSELLALAGPNPSATHLSILRSRGGDGTAEFRAIKDANDVIVGPNDLITILEETRPQSILITISGEQNGPPRQVLPYGARLSDAIAKIIPGPRSNLVAIQLFRQSVADRQKILLNQALDNLQSSVLNARSSTLEEAQLRATESKSILDFIERARAVTPKGQIILGPKEDFSKIYLESGDILYVPPKSNLISVYGEVRFPNTQVYRSSARLRDYIDSAGGFTDSADLDNIIIINTDGSIVNLDSEGKSIRSFRPMAGDEVMILPKPDTKKLQFAKEISTIVYQIAIAARVALKL